MRILLFFITMAFILGCQDVEQTLGNDVDATSSTLIEAADHDEFEDINDNDSSVHENLEDSMSLNDDEKVDEDDIISDEDLFENSDEIVSENPEKDTSHDDEISDHSELDMEEPDEIVSENPQQQTCGEFTCSTLGTCNQFETKISCLCDPGYGGERCQKFVGVDYYEREFIPKGNNRNFKTIIRTGDLYLGTGVHLGDMKVAPASALNIDTVSETSCHNESQSKSFRLLRIEDDFVSHPYSFFLNTIDNAYTRFSPDHVFVDEVLKMNDRIYFAAEISVDMCNYSIDNPTFKPDAKELLENDYNAFREKYGDTYLHTVSTGGRFVILVEIASFDKSRYIVEKEVKILLQNDDLEESLQTVREKFDAHVYYFNGVDETYAPVSPEKAVGELNYFLESLDSDECRGEFAYLTCPYQLATFVNYSELEPMVNMQDAYVQNDVLDTITEEHRRCDNLLKKIDHIEHYPYMWDTHNMVDVIAFKQHIIENRTALLNQYEQCKDSYDACFVPDDLMKVCNRNPEQLPGYKGVHPKNCINHKILYGDTTDGDYVAYFDNKNWKYFNISCKNMDSDQPETYLPLDKTSPNAQHSSYNVSRYNYKDPVTLITGIMSTSYEKLKIRVHKNSVEVIPDQEFFLKTHIPYNLQGVEELDDAIAYGTAGSCLFYNPIKDIAMNINVQNTPFIVSGDIDFKLRGKQFEKVDQQSNWLAANSAAELKGGYLPTIADDSDTEKYINIMKEHGWQSMWIGLYSDSEHVGKYKWASGFPRNESTDTYSNWAYETLKYDKPGEMYCVEMHSDGTWTESPCLQERQFLIEYNKVNKEIVISDDNKEITIFNLTSKLYGQCVEIGAVPSVILEYKPES